MRARRMDRQLARQRDLARERFLRARRPAAGRPAARPAAPAAGRPAAPAALAAGRPAAGRPAAGPADTYEEPAERDWGPAARAPAVRAPRLLPAGYANLRLRLPAKAPGSLTSSDAALYTGTLFVLAYLAAYTTATRNGVADDARLHCSIFPCALAAVAVAVLLYGLWRFVGRLYLAEWLLVPWEWLGRLWVVAVFANLALTTLFHFLTDNIDVAKGEYVWYSMADGTGKREWTQSAATRLLRRYADSLPSADDGPFTLLAKFVSGLWSIGVTTVTASAALLLVSSSSNLLNTVLAFALKNGPPQLVGPLLFVVCGALIALFINFFAPGWSSLVAFYGTGIAQSEFLFSEMMTLVRRRLDRSLLEAEARARGEAVPFVRPPPIVAPSPTTIPGPSFQTVLAPVKGWIDYTTDLSRVLLERIFQPRALAPPPSPQQAVAGLLPLVGACDRDGALKILAFMRKAGPGPVAEAWRADPDLRRWRSEAVLSAIAARDARLAAKIVLTNRDLALKGGSPFFFEDDGLARWASSDSYLDHIALFAPAEQVEIYETLGQFDRRCERFFSFENVAARRVEFGAVFRVERVLAEHAAGRRGFVEAAGMSYMLGEAVGGAQRDAEVAKRVAQLDLPYGPLPGVAGGPCLECGDFAASPWMLPDRPSFVDTWAVQRRPALALCDEPDKAGLRTCRTLSGARLRCFEAAPATAPARGPDSTQTVCVPAGFTETMQVPPMCKAP
jgi:hypothetical protein